MKKTAYTFVLAASLFIISCNNKEAAPVGEPGTGTDTTAVDNTSIEKPEPVAEAAPRIKVSGKVTQVSNGKDGYTARLNSGEGKTYFATISIPNLEDPDQYRQVKLGDSITVAGENWKMKDEEHITVKELE